MQRKPLWLSVVLGGAAYALSASANALPILTGLNGDGDDTWVASDAAGRSAEAEFSLSGGILTITLTNLSTDGGKVVPNEVLVGLIFGFGSDASVLDPSVDGMVNVTASALGALNPGDLPLTWGLNLDGEYGYKEIDEPGLGNYALSASAYDPLGINDEIDPTKAYSPDNVGGADFGIVSSSATSYSNSITFWVVDSLTIQLMTSGLSSIDDISQVSFLYGTSYSTVQVPEPGTLSLIGGGLLLVGILRRRKPLAA